MSWKILVCPKAREDLEWFRINREEAYRRAFDLIRITFINPRRGLGKPTQLGIEGLEIWSRRLSHVHRIIYVVQQESWTIRVVSCKSS